MTRRNAYLLPAALALALLAAGPAAAAIDHDQPLKSCLALAERRPAEAMDSARAWQERGGGDLARLCEALALFHKGDFAAAGARLEELAPALGRDDPKAAASILGRAGWAWLRAGDHPRAERLYSQALERQPDDVDLRIDRAFARAEAERFWDALADLDAAIARDPGRADAYLYRAAAHKALANDRQAAADVDRTLELRPGDPEALLLRGNIKAQGGNLAGAREDWTLIRRLAPDSAVARSAGVNLERVARMEAPAKGAPEAGRPPEPRPAPRADKP